MIQFPRGWNRWRLWIWSGVDDDGREFTTLEVRLRRSGRVRFLTVGSWSKR